MIEIMIKEVKPYLPLKIDEAIWDGNILNIYGPGWGFNTLSVWRLSQDGKMLVGCYDERSCEVMEILRNLKIINIVTQESFLKVDPVFILSNNQKIEIFSTDTYEPWYLSIHGFRGYAPTPSEPDAFNQPLP